ncbi:hypothetical protein IQ06DRAFT_354214 [Phaeosphaeriaceae sp. SRC1lsM3a]|nr:hypothetical protein IQ06DRAFT_354214 [Stagonospora sp. SRC1lsM3a]
MPSLFARMSPKTRILGLNLTHTVASLHLKTCLSLMSLISLQIPAIRRLDADVNRLDFVGHLQDIQTRHLDITNKLSCLVQELVGAGKEIDGWVNELGDALASMKGKVRMCNHMSTSSSSPSTAALHGSESGSGGSRSATEKENEKTRGYKAVAITYWPLIAETYTLLKPVLERVRDEVSDGLDRLGARRASSQLIMPGYTYSPSRPEPHQRRSRRHSSVVTWFGGKPKAKAPAKPTAKPVTTVRFEKDVQARWFWASERPHSLLSNGIEDGNVMMQRDHVVPLSSDKKRSAGKYGSKKGTVNGKAKTGNVGGWIPSTGV